MIPAPGDRSAAGLGPFGWALVAAATALTPLSAVLLQEYGEASDRHFAKQLPVTPPEATPTAAMGIVRPELGAGELEVVYRAQPSPRSGVLTLYRILSDGGVQAMLAVVRHDILCASCRDVLLAVVLDPAGEAIEAVVNMVPREVDGARVEAALFLSQWAHRPVADVLSLGEIDAITGATRTVHAVVDEMAALQGWRRRHVALFAE